MSFGKRTLAEVVHSRAKSSGDEIAYTFLADGATDARSMTWSQLDHRAGALAGELVQRGAAGQPVMLAMPSGLAFIESLFACWYAGAIALPVSLPRHKRNAHRLHRIISDSGAVFAIGADDTRQRCAGEENASPIQQMVWIDPAAAGSGRPIDDLTIRSQDVALLQYTSGSTGAPRGVEVSHDNLFYNSRDIAEACGHASGQTIAGWLPLFHDMGLIGLVLQAAYAGTRCVLMSPERFLMRPALWLQMISDYRVCSSPAPNFAYDLCAEKVDAAQKAKLDLTCWRNALNGSEPVRPATLDRFAAAFAECGFSANAFFPCYGLAEATLFVTGPDERRGSARRTANRSVAEPAATNGHVGCGRVYGDTRLAIVDPQTATLVEPGAIGEIWIAGASVASGYWKNPEATVATFHGILNSARAQDADTRWLRTGDLGFIADGDLFITGRLREMVIIAGKNHFPVDLERTVEAADAAIAASGAGAFSVDVNGAERLVIVAEVRREHAAAKGDAGQILAPQALCNRLRAAVASEHEVAVHEVVLLAPGGLPRTTSGKISRRATRDSYLAQTLPRFGAKTS